MNGSVLFEGNPLLSGSLNVNTGGNIEPLEVEITENGTREITPPSGVDGYAPITIDTNVPIPKPVLDTLNVTSNGTYTPPEGVDGYDEVNVNVPTPVLDDITITANGTYTPPSGVDGYDEITVNVSQDADIQPLTRTITTNGTTVINASDLNVDGFDPVTITTDVDGYTIKTLANTPVPIASFNDGTANPLKSLTASIVPVQDLHGYDSPWAGGAGKNKWNDDATQYPSSISLNNHEYVFNGISEGAQILAFPFAVIDTQSYSISFDAKAEENDTRINFDGQPDGVTGLGYDKNEMLTTTYQHYRYTGSVDSSYTGFRFFRTSANPNSNKKIYIKNIQLELGSPTLYAPYSNICPISGWTEEVITVADDLQNPTVTHTTTIPFTDSQGQSVEVFGGSVDVDNGVVTPCPYYASYNGEQLTGEWISDRDVYSPNTSPTIGAQVVNIGATGTPFSVQPTSIKSLDGENNVFASTGDVEEIKYFANL